MVKISVSMTCGSGPRELPVGKLAIAQFLEFEKLAEVIGKRHRAQIDGHSFDMIPLPHPSGASTWHRTEPGKTLLRKALSLIKRHSSFKSLLD